jgi:glycosyltransferase involved in cell wall biosynthesis
MRRLTAVLITRNEEDRLARALASIGCADEVLVVDAESQDGTAAIARAAGCRVVSRGFQGFGPQRRFAAEQAAHDWILMVDADEVLSPELNREIRALLDGPEEPRACYRIPQTLVFMGRPFRFGHHAREYHVRLFDRRRAGYDDAPVHEGVRCPEAPGVLRGSMTHHSFRDLHHLMEKLNGYTTAGGAALRQRGRGRSPALAVLSMPYHFLRHYFLHRNFLNGVQGLVWSAVYSLAPMLKHLKAREPEGGWR